MYFIMFVVIILYFTETYIFMMHVLQHAKLPVRSFGMNGGLERSGQLLNGHLSIGRLVLGRAV